MDGWTTDRPTDGWKDRQAGRQMDGQTTDRRIDRQAGRQINRQAGRQTKREAERQTDTQADALQIVKICDSQPQRDNAVNS